MIESYEFNIFSRPIGDIQKLLGALPKPSMTEIAEKYEETFQIQVHFYGLSRKEELKEVCAGFAAFQKKMVPILKDLLLRTIWHIKVKDAELRENKKYLKSM